MAFTGGSDLAAFGTGGGLGTTSFDTVRASAVGRNLGAGGDGGVNRRPNFGTALVAFGITAHEGREEGEDVQILPPRLLRSRNRRRRRMMNALSDHIAPLQSISVCGS